MAERSGGVVAYLHAHAAQGNRLILGRQIGGTFSLLSMNLLRIEFIQCIRFYFTPLTQSQTSFR